MGKLLAAIVIPTISGVSIFTHAEAPEREFTCEGIMTAWYGGLFAPDDLEGHSAESTLTYKEGEERFGAITVTAEGCSEPDDCGAIWQFSLDRLVGGGSGVLRANQAFCIEHGGEYNCLWSYLIHNRNTGEIEFLTQNPSATEMLALGVDNWQFKGRCLEDEK
ncbi:MAG: hypothetical protein ABJ308_13185 [Halieaceae bacterium]